MEAHDLDLGHGLLDNLEVVLAHLHHLVEFGETLVGVEDQSADGLVLATVGQSEVEELVGLVDLQASREDVVAVGGLLRDIVSVVVLVLDVAEDLLDDVLQRDDARGAAKLIDDDANRLLLTEEDLHEFLCRHGLGDEGHLADMVVPFLAGAEEFEGVDVADDVVDVLLVDEDLGVAALDKLLLQLVGRAVVGDGIDLRARHHAVADLEVGEVEGILEDLHLVVDLASLRRVVDGGLDEVVEVHLGKRAVVVALLHLDAQEAQEEAREQGGEAAPAEAAEETATDAE